MRKLGAMAIPRILMVHLSSLLLSVFMLTYPQLGTSYNPSVPYTYSRFSEVDKHCGSVLQSRVELKPDDNRGERIKTELTFLNGDWDQEMGGVPFMVYDESDSYTRDSTSGSFSKLVSFWVTDVDPVRRSENMISVSGIMYLGITDGTYSYRPYERSADHSMSRGQSKLTLLFEGVYIESSEENGGGRLMCLLGTSVRPKYSNQVMDPHEYLNEYGYDNNQKPPLVHDDQIMLLLRYPKTSTLTTRGIRGEIRCLNNMSDPNYFDLVRISSQLGHYSKYQFGAEEVLNACTPYPSQDKLVNEDAQMFKGENFCGILQNLLRNTWFSFMITSDLMFWPFIDLGLEIEVTADTDIDIFRLLGHNVQCKQENEPNNIKTAHVSAVFRVIRSSEQRYIAEERTGLSGMILTAEGMWSTSNGKLCMVGCVGIGSTSHSCNSRICLYFPLTISITQRSIIYGTISSVSGTESRSSLLFEKVTMPSDFREYQYRRYLKWSYKYSKIIQASDFQLRSGHPSMLRTKLRKSLLKYPSYLKNDNASLYSLTDELSIDSYAFPYPFNNAKPDKTLIKIEILSIGSLFGRYFPQKHGKHSKLTKQNHPIAESIEVSGHITATGANNVSLFMEGLYDPVVGNMYLIGCKDVRAFPSIITNSSLNLERGMDCEIEIKIEYPSKNARWLINPKVRISINSKRSEEDPLHFSSIRLESSSIAYNNQNDDILFRKGFEAVLRIVLLAMASLCLSRQVKYINTQEEAIPYISLVMLGVQAISFSVPLITDKKVPIEWKATTPYNHRAYGDFKDTDVIYKFLLLLPLLSILRLYTNIMESRRVGLSHTLSGKKFRSPSDKLVLLITVGVHIHGFVIFNVISMMKNTTTQVAINKNMLKWLGEVNDYWSLIQDLFLLPQIIGNILWRIQVKPLSKFYYIGFTAIRALVHIYEYIREPIFDPKNFQYNEIKTQNSVGDSKHCDIAMAFTVIVLCIIVHLQQRGTDTKSSRTVKSTDHAMEAELHERLLS